MPRPFAKMPLITFFTVFFILAIIWNVYLYFLPDHFQTANYLFNVYYCSSGLIAGIIILLNIYRRHGGGEVASSLSYLALGAIMFAIALYIWSYYNLVLRVPIPHPSVDEAFFVVYPFLLTIGTVRLLRFYTGLLNWRVVIEAIIVFLLTAVPVTYFFIIPSISPDSVWIANFIIFAVVAGNSTLVSIVYLIVRIGGGRLRWLLSLYGVSYLMLIASQFTFQYRTGFNIYWNGDVSDSLIVIHLYLFCLATIYTLDTVFGPSLPTASPGGSDANTNQPSQSAIG